MAIVFCLARSGAAYIHVVHDEAADARSGRMQRALIEQHTGTCAQHDTRSCTSKPLRVVLVVVDRVRFFQPKLRLLATFRTNLTSNLLQAHEQAPGRDGKHRQDQQHLDQQHLARPMQTTRFLPGQQPTSTRPWSPPSPALPAWLLPPKPPASSPPCGVKRRPTSTSAIVTWVALGSLVEATKALTKATSRFNCANYTDDDMTA